MHAYSIVFYQSVVIGGEGGIQFVDDQYTVILLYILCFVLGCTLSHKHSSYHSELLS